MQGQQALFTTLFPSSLDRAKTKGSSNLHTDRRDEALACRYYYYMEVVRNRYDDVLVQLEKEFFITPAVIIQRLTAERSLLKGIIGAKPKLSDLKKKYPYFIW